MHKPHSSNNLSGGTKVVIDQPAVEGNIKVMGNVHIKKKNKR